MKIVKTSRFNEVHKAVEENGGYCPCMLLQNEDTKCICKEFRDQLKENKCGTCHCGAYEIVE